MQPLKSLVCVILFSWLAASAQGPADADSAVTSADTAYIAKDWAAAESQYSSLASQHPENARFWYRLGVSARGNRHYDVALAAMQKAKALGAGKGLPAPLADYEIATIHAGKGESSLALELLKAAANSGFMQAARVENDSEWNGLRSNDQFLALAKQVHHNAAPCEDRSSSSLTSG